jgi:hypothetical protein
MRGKVFKRKWHLHATPTSNELFSTYLSDMINNDDYAFYTKLGAQSMAIDLTTAFYGKVFVTVVR